MKLFAHLINELDATTKTNLKVAALVRYFQKADEQDKLWTIALFTSRRPKRVVKVGQLRTWAAECAQIPLWLFEESYHIVGDLAETIALLVPQTSETELGSLTFYIDLIQSLKDKAENEQQQTIQAVWSSMDKTQRFIFNKILTGGFRIGVSQKFLTKALAKVLELDEAVIAHRLMGNWSPVTHSFETLLIEPSEQDEAAKPYPFYLAYALDKSLEELGVPSDWMAERKWDGIRGQVIIRNGEMFVWSRGEELVTDKYPELEVLKNELDNCVLDGELLAFKDGAPLPFHDMQKRIGRKKVSKKQLVETPVILMTYDILELEGEDLRSQNFELRRKKLEELLSNVTSPTIQLSPLVPFDDWQHLEKEQAKSRELKCEGLMLKQKNSVYQVGRKRGDWWKWKVEPLTIDAVLTYAMRGHGRRANLYTDYTFALWKDGQLVTFAKAYSGLTDKEILEVNRFVQQNIIEKFGPVVSVEPKLVFEIAFEGVALSKRHKSGVAVRFPRIKRIRYDKKIEAANSVSDIMKLV